MIRILRPDGRRVDFFHAIKTGGSWVEQLAEATRTVQERFPQHDPAWMRGSPDGTLRVGSTRDPYTWYPSLYYHALRSARYVDLGAYGRRHTDFKSVLHGWTHADAMGEVDNVATIWDASPLRGSACGAFRNSHAQYGIGLWTWVQLFMYAAPATWMGNTEVLQYGGGFPWMVDVLLQQSRMDEACRKIIGLDGTNLPAFNTSGHKDYESMYDSEMIQWVCDSDVDLSDHLGQRPFDTAYQPCVWVGSGMPHSGGGIAFPTTAVPQRPPSAGPPYLTPPASGERVVVFTHTYEGKWRFGRLPIRHEAFGGFIDAETFWLIGARWHDCPRVMVHLPPRHEMGVTGYWEGTFAVTGTPVPESSDGRGSNYTTLRFTRGGSSPAPHARPRMDAE